MFKDPKKNEEKKGKTGKTGKKEIKSVYNCKILGIIV